MRESWNWLKSCGVGLAGSALWLLQMNTKNTGGRKMKKRTDFF
jgi:hypothetical protein